MPPAPVARIGQKRRAIASTIRAPIKGRSPAVSPPPHHPGKELFLSASHSFIAQRRQRQFMRMQARAES